MREAKPAVDLISTQASYCMLLLAALFYYFPTQLNRPSELVGAIHPIIHKTVALILNSGSQFGLLSLQHFLSLPTLQKAQYRHGWLCFHALHGCLSGGQADFFLFFPILPSFYCKLEQCLS